MPEPLYDPTAMPVPVRMVHEPAGGIPEVISSPAQFEQACQRLGQGSAALAVDVERACGFRYTGRAYLIQVHRHNSGTFLFDPLSWDPSSPQYTGIDVAPLRELLCGEPAPLWILHAATQDLPCLALEGLLPRRLFDTELAGRLLGFPRVALGVMTEQVLGIGLEKGFSAVDWSRRPLPLPWLGYAALDVEFLLPLHEALQQQLQLQGKADWAQQEFSWLVEQALARPTSLASEPSQNPEAWRRTSGIHRVRHPRELAVVQHLWLARDSMASATDTAPSRLLNDKVIIEAAQKKPSTRRALQALPSMRTTIAPARYYNRWLAAIDHALQLPPQQWPPVGATVTEIPSVRMWRQRNPAAAARLASARQELSTLGQQYALPAENLLWPEALRQVAWQQWPSGVATQELTPQLSHALAAAGARPWQVQLCAPALALAFTQPSTSSDL